MNRLTAFSTVLILIIFSNCNRGNNNQNSNKITLTYWSANNQDEINLAVKLVDEWNRTHPDVQVKHQPIPESRSSEEVILASVVGKTTPDIYSNMWPGDVELYVRANILLPLDQFTDFDSLAHSRFSDEKYRESHANDGHVYQILWKTNPIMMIYNKKNFEEIGFSSPPRTYGEVFQAAEKLSKDTDGDGYIDRWIGITNILVTWWQRFFDYLPLYLAASGGEPLIKDNKVAFNNQNSVDVFRFLQTLFVKDYYPKERMDARADVFLHSIVATRYTGPWEIMHANKFKPKGFEFGFAPIPTPRLTDDPVYTYGDYKSIIIFKNSKYPKESWEFAKFLVSKKADLALLETTNQLPIRKNILQDSSFVLYFHKNPMMVKFAEQANHVRGVDNCPVLREVFDAISQEFEACVIYGTKSPEDAVAAAAKRAELIMR